jgi:carbon-monoxide dehydrogenase medium subunit
MSALVAVSPPHRAALAALLAGAEGPLTFIAGGTDLLVAPRALPADGLLVDLTRARDLAGVAVKRNVLRIGAAATLAALAENAVIRARLPALAEAAAQCGSVQIRNRATLGGNVATASPASDLTPALACFGARFRTLARDGERRRGFKAMVPAAGGSGLARGEAIVAAEISLAGRLGRSAFAKLGVRDDLAIARLNLALEAEFDGARFGAARLYAGAVAPAPRRLARAERALAGRALDAATLEDFDRALVADIEAAIPGRASLGYKRRAVVGLGRDLLARLTGCLE